MTQKSNNFSFFNEKGVTPTDTRKSRTCQSFNNMVFHEKVKMITHLRHLSCCCVGSSVQPYWRRTSLSQRVSKQFLVEMSQNGVTQYDFGLRDKIFLIRTYWKHYAWNLKRLGSQIDIYIIFMDFLK